MASDTAELKDRFKTAMGVLIALVALVTAVAAWRASGAARRAGFEDYYALTATLRERETRTVTTAKAYEHYAGFTNYAVNRELAGLLEEDHAATKTDAQKIILEYQIAESEKLAATNRNFFSARYVKRSGDYDLTRELAEEYADAERRHDLDTDAHLERSNKQDLKTFAFVQTVILLGVTLLCFTFASAFHPDRRILRWSAALGGTACLLISIAAIVMTEIS